MCDGKLASKRDVVILSIKPKRPDYPSSQKVVPVSELLQEWDKLDAYYRGQLLKLTKSFTKSAQVQKDNGLSNSKHHHQKNSRQPYPSPNNNKVNNHNKHSNHHNTKSSSYPVNKKHSSSLSSDQFTELFGDENLFSPVADADTNNNNSNRHNHRNNNHSSNKSSKLLLSRSLNSLFDEDESLENDLLPAPPPSSRSRSTSNANSRKSSLSSVNGNLVVSIPVLSVQQQRDNYNSGHKNSKRLSKYFSDEDNESSGVSEDEHDDNEDDDEPDNFLSVPRDNFQVQYGTKQKTRVALLENTGSVSPRFIVPIRVAPYKPPAAQGLNGVQIQKILYHKNDKVNYASPTTTTARTPDKPPDNQNSLSPPASLTVLTKSAKVSSENNSPVSTVSPRSIGSGTTITVTPPSSHSGFNNNNATPKQAASQSPPDLSSPKSDQGYKSSSSTSSSSSAKLSSPPVNSTTGNHHNQQQKLKRPISLTENYSSSFSSSTTSSSSSSSSGYGKKQRLGSSSSSDSANLDRSPSGYNFLPVTSSNYAFSSLPTASSFSSSTSSLSGDTLMENDHHSHSQSPSRSRHSSTSSSSSATSSRFNATTDNATETSGKSSSSNTSPKANHSSKQKLNIINKNPSFVKPPSTTTNSSSSSSAGDHSVFLAPAAVSITDRIIKKASRPQPELIERQRRRRLESNQRKSYALQKGDEHEERESIDLSMKSFEMIWNVPLLSPLRSP